MLCCCIKTFKALCDIFLYILYCITRPDGDRDRVITQKSPTPWMCALLLCGCVCVCVWDTVGVALCGYV